MPKRIYQVGEPCDVCGTPTIAGRDGNGYCKPCYIEWKSKQEGMQPAQGGYAPKSYRPTQQAMGQRKEIQNTMNYKADQIAKAQANKEDSMRLFSSGRDAVLIVTAFYKDNPLSDEEIKTKIEEWRKYLYNKIYADTPFVA